MRILHVYKDYFPVLGGIENHVKVLAEGQAAAGHQVTVLVTSLTRATSAETLDGVRVDFAEGWGLVRASNTGAFLTARFEANSEEALETIKGDFRAQLARVAPDLQLPF